MSIVTKYHRFLVLANQISCFTSCLLELGPANNIEALFCGKFKSHLRCLCIKDPRPAVIKQLGWRMSDGQMMLVVANLKSNV